MVTDGSSERKNPRRKPEKKHLYKQMPVTDGEELECDIWEEWECDMWKKEWEV